LKEDDTFGEGPDRSRMWSDQVELMRISSDQM